MGVHSFSAIFSSSEAVSQEMRTLSHLAEVSRGLGRGLNARSDARQRLEKLAEQLMQISSSMQPEQSICLDSLRKRVGLSLPYPYFPSQLGPVTSEKLRGVAERILQDMISLKVIPIKSPRLGKHGPTFLVDYPRKIENSEAPHYCAFVMKNVDALEVVCNRIYFEFANCGHRNTYFFVPQTSFIDLTRKKYFSFSGECSEIFDVDSLRQNLDRIGSSMKKFKSFLKMVLLAEKIRGQNILDFISSAEYSDASEERKKSFFFNLGAISLLDLIVGHLERFFAVDLVALPLLSSELAANLGNALIVPSKDENALLCAIDNGISPCLCLGIDDRAEWSNKPLRESYNQLIRDVISSPEGLEGFVANILNSLTIWEDFSENEDMPSKPTPFFTDLKDPKLSVDSIRKGVLEMGLYIKNQVIPFWDGRRSENLKNFIRTNCDIISDPLNERIDVFRKFYNLNKEDL